MQEYTFFKRTSLLKRMKGDSMFMHKHIDLHVHTPASKDYQGKKNEREYFSIVKNAFDNNIHTICVTDHFSLEGYKKIINLKDSIYLLLKDLKQREQDNISVDYIHTVEEEYKIINSVHVLMGVEVKVSPGIHYILVFKESIKPKEVEEFLFRLDPDIPNNYGSDVYKLDISSSQFIDSASEHFGDNAFIYAPHCDSDSGLNESLKKFGDERLKVFGNDYLLCVSFNKEQTRSYIKNNLEPNFKHNRSRLLNYIQDSDYHGKKGEKVGAFSFSIETNKKASYDQIVSALSSTEFIKTSIDTAQEDFQNEISGKKIFEFDLTEKNLEDNDIAETACAILNSDEGSLVFTVNFCDPYNYTEDANGLLQDLLDYLNKEIGYSTKKADYSFFITSSSEQKLLIELEVSNRLYLFNGYCYIISSDNDVVLAKSHEIESIVALKIHNRYGRVKDLQIDSIQKNTAKIKSTLKSFSVAYKKDNYMDYHKYLNELEFLEPNILNQEQFKEVLKQRNGMSHGNVVVISGRSYEVKKGRLENSYFRLSPPRYLLNVDEGYENVEPDSIILYRGGGIHLISEKVKIIAEAPCFYLMIDKSNSTTYNEYVTIAYLQSSFFQWFINKVLNFDDVFHYFLSNQLNLHVIDLECIKDVLEEKVKIILHNETMFLDEFNQLLSSNEDNSKESLELIDSHNTTCNSLMKEIDLCIFKALNFSEKEIKIIHEDLADLGVYCFDFEDEDYKNIR